MPLLPRLGKLVLPKLLFDKVEDSGVVAGTGFEPVKAMPADLQSAPVDRLGILPRGRLARTTSD